MLVQHSFKKAYSEELAERVRQGLDLELYAQEEFSYDKSQVVILPTLPHPEGLSEKMIPTTQGDFQSAVALFEAYPKLTPVQASDRSFWIYLAHVDLFRYVQQRFSKIKEQGFNNSQYILDHWYFAQGSIMHSLAGLWWLTYLTVDEDSSSERYKYTKVIFQDYTMRTNLAQYAFARHKEALFGYFQFILDYPEVFSSFFKSRNRFITKHFNKIGGSRLLSTLPREYFYDELCRIKPLILEVFGTEKEMEDSDDYDSIE